MATKNAARRGNVGAAAAHDNVEGQQLTYERFIGNKGRSFAALSPSGRYAFVDKIQCWLRTPLDPNQLAMLQKRCGGTVHVKSERARFDGSYVQRLQLHQPKPEALAWITSSEGLRINYVELALDLTFDSAEELDAAHDLIGSLHWKTHHGKQEVRIVNGETRYSAPRSAPNVFVTYADKPCRITGEVFCLHMEWRMRGKALRNTSLAATLEQGPRAFWRSRLIFREIDLTRFGYLALNRQDRTKRRGEHQAVSRGGFIYDLDLRAGGILMHSLGKSTQAVLDSFKCARPNQFSISLSVDHLLPSDNEGWGVSFL